MKNCMSRLRTGPFTHVSQYWWKQSFHVFGTGLTGPRQGYKLPKTSFGILVGIYRDNIPTHTPQSG